MAVMDGMSRRFPAHYCQQSTWLQDLLFWRYLSSAQLYPSDPGPHQSALPAPFQPIFGVPFRLLVRWCKCVASTREQFVISELTNFVCCFLVSMNGGGLVLLQPDQTFSVRVQSSDAVPTHPIIFVIRQQKAVTSWELPFILESSGHK